jgi:LPPG:FO 2-phospho-L-lactate transferase
MIVALCGGVGGAKLVDGLFRNLPAQDLTVIVNTADDLEFCGLRVSPDLDTVTYTLAGIARKDVGWGIEGDTHNALTMLRDYGVPDWFQVGDRDLATDVLRTSLLRQGRRLSDVTALLTDRLGIAVRILPVSDDDVTTRLLVDGDWVHFQEYFVHRRHAVPVEGVRYEGAEEARPAPGVIDALRDADLIVVVNSNPVLSILPMLAVTGVREALHGARAPRVAVSPIVGSDAVTGPAGDLMRLVGCPASATGVACAFEGMVDGLVIDRRDGQQESAIRGLGPKVFCTDIVMRDVADRARLASEVLSFARSLR